MTTARPVIKSPRLLLLLLPCLFLGAWRQAGPPGKEHSFAWLQQHFARPPHTFGSAPLWVWNTKVNKAIIDTMLLQFKQNGFGGVFVHPRPGLVTEYLSQDWFDHWKYAMEKGRQLGLDVWIYDENSYPSGFAGGHVPAQMPSSWNQGQMLHLVKATQLPDTAARFFLCLKATRQGFADITRSLEQEKGKTGEYYLFDKQYYARTDWYGGFSYVDLMVKGVTEKFIDITMKGYEKAVGEAFGKTVKGIFTDEPNIETQGRGNVRWTPDLFDTFSRTWGYDLRPQLPCLYEERGNWKKVRHDYYQVLLQLFIDRWSKPWYDYTEKKGLEWTGHYWEHGWPSPNHGGDNMAMYAWHQRPAIDLLFNQFNEESPNAQFGNIRSVKELASVANQLGKKRTLCETYGGGGWELTLMDMKRLGDWQYALGVNTMNQHLSFMTITGARKYDYPQSFSYHSPWWPYYKAQNEYFARLSLALSRGQQRNRILVLEPTTSAWMYYSQEHANARFGEIGQQFQRFVTALEKAQVEYDLGSENIIRDHGSARARDFVVGERVYSTVIIPPGMENIDRPTFELLQRYTAAGGRVLCYERLQLVDGAPDEALARWQQQHPLQSPGLPPSSVTGSNDLAFPGIDTVKGKLYHHRRQLNDGQLLFLANSDMQAQASGRLRLKGRQLKAMDLHTGRLYDYPAASINGMLEADYSLPPAGSLLLFASAGSLPASTPYPKPLAGAPLATSPLSIRRAGPNVLTIDFCDVQLGDSTFSEQHVNDAANRAFRYYGFRNGNPWNTSVQYRRNIVNRDTFGVNTQVKAAYHFNIAEGTDLRSLRAAVERPGVWKVHVNGQPAQLLQGQWWLDKEIAVYDIARLVKPGRNTLEITAAPMRIMAEIEPVYILGNFNLQPAAKGWEIIPAGPLQLGSWKEQGMPLYGHDVVYRKTCDLDRPQGRYQVQLNSWKGTIATVTVNGRFAGAIETPPFTLDISRFMKKGRNDIAVTVTGSLKNTLGPHHNKPRPGLVSPWLWRNVKAYTPGSAYDLYDYGMMEDFSITLAQ